jgi:AraC-like DNA-binding protein
MNPGETLELLARGSAVGAFLGLALLSVRGRRTPARLTGALFCLGAAAHTLTQLPSSEAALGFMWWPVWSFSIMGAGLFWAFAHELFEDGGALDLRRFAPALALLAVGAAALSASGAAQRALYLTHNALGAALIAHALFLIARGWRGDLVETRRRLRGPILATASIYALAVIAVQTGELFVGSAQALSPIAAAALLLLGLLSLAAFARMDPSLFGAPAAASALATPQINVPPPDRADAETIAALDRLMREQRVHREEGLTIAALALRLKLPEHRLRKLINQHLGHRNFSAYLNQWRIGEAKAALADPTQIEVPISTIALDAGFASLGPFNRAFKAETGQTPSEFRDVALTKKP